MDKITPKEARIKMPKIIVNTGTLSAGGAERVLSILSKPLADAFDEVQYVMWLDAKYPDIFYDIDPRIKIIRLSKESGTTNILRQMMWFRRYIKHEQPDVVMTFMIALCFTVTCSLFFSGFRQVVALRNDPTQMRRKWLRQLSLWSFHSHDIKGILVQTESVRQFFRKNKQLICKTSVIYNPIVLEQGFVGEALNSSKQDIVVSVGRLSYQKQPKVLLRAFRDFTYTHPNYKLIIYGDGELREELLALASELGIEEKVSLPGRSKHVVQEILSARFFVMTSKVEGMSNALLEAMSVGLPCISTKVSGATELIQDGVNGFLTEIGDVETITKIMSQLADDEALRNKLGKNATQIYNDVSEEKVGRHWVKYLNDIIAK